MHPNAELIQRFYVAFSQRDAADMAACYHPEVRFSDPAFPDLRGPAAGAMWAMLLARGKDLIVQFGEIAADDQNGRAHWDATYTFSKTGRKVLNRIDARFRFKDGLIVEHVDEFSFPRWSRQALGLPGLLLGHTAFLQRKVQAEAAKSLAAWQVQKAK
ncbi:MAG: nuclear transport factor 2 family protein [Stagnimonas sp.]|nr:nuclear transport factor 2 family protein [Stagnimonas sp.]